MTNKVVKIEGMGCPKCAAKVQKALEELKGVDKVEVSLEEKMAKVYLQEVKEPSDEEIKLTVQALDYKVTEIE